ncbi:MAG: replicative DNA helicase, partial [Victivallales bacterium]|nr:replicative DNA helicase [Victivallales bacterium]
MSEMASTTASMLNLDRPKPHNEEAEIAVLGAMLFSTEAVSSAMGALKLENAFYRPAHQTIFNAMVELTAGKSEVALDPLVVSDHLERNGKLEEVGGRAYIAQLMDSVPTAANIDYYVEIVKQNAILRHIIATCTETIQQCYGAEDDVHALLDGIEQKIFEVTGMNETKDLQSVQPLVREAVDYLEKLIKGNPDILGLRTGFDIDKMITGLKPGEMFVLAARPSIGKTALALNMAANIAMNPSHPAPVGIFSLEMPALSLILRMICSESRVGLAEFRNKTINASRWTDVMRAADSLNKAKIVIDDTGAIDILELRAKARRMKAKHNVEAIFVDYLQLIRAHTKSNASRENEVSMISGSLKAMAKELNIPVVVLAQLNRQAEQGEKPKLSQLRESGAIEQDADVVAL